MLKYHKNFIFGAPVRHKDEEAYEKAIIESFDGDMNKALASVEAAADRQQSKSSGIISCASILAGVSYFVHANIPLILVLIAILLSVGSFYSKWPVDAEIFKDKEKSFDHAVNICYDRAVFNSISAFLIFVAVVLLIPSLLF